MSSVTGDEYLESLVRFVESNADRLIDGTVVLKLNPVGLRYVQSRLEALEELERLSTGAPVDYLRAYVSDLGDHRALEQLRRILRLIPSLKVVSALPRDPTPLYLVPFLRLKVLELRGCDLSTSAAKGLVELRFTLEKLICHDSTDALRHVFASRIAEIKDWAQWRRLSFVSCACNGLVIMDESLQLLPAVETLDLSRNKIAKANNLWKCTKLRHLDLGFNSLRSIKPFGEVSCQMVKLVLRSNALTTLKGIENMRSIEELDLSYNIISKFSEVEILSSLPYLQNLWLEGNPLCYARSFRAKVFSFFPHPEMLELDGKNIAPSELWKRKFIVASRTKQPASFGFYSPIKDNADTEDRRSSVKRKKCSRLASIGREEQATHTFSEKDPATSDYDIESRDDNDMSAEEAEIEDLIKKIESMKKEDSVLWLQEFKEWMNRSSDHLGDAKKTHLLKKIEKVPMKIEAGDDELGETSRYISDSAPFSGDESSTVNLVSETSFADASTVVSGPQYLDRIDEAPTEPPIGHAVWNTTSIAENGAGQEIKPPLKSGMDTCVYAGDSWFSSTAVPIENTMSTKNIISSPAVNETPISLLSSSCPGSPPHYVEDILHRRQNLEEEFLQLSAHSFSVASSDSETSCSEDIDADSIPDIAIVRQSATGNDRISGRSTQNYEEDLGETYREENSAPKSNGMPTSRSAAKECALQTEADEEIMSAHASHGSLTSPRDSESQSSIDGTGDRLEKKRARRKPTRRMVSLWEEDDNNGCNDKTSKSNYNESCICDLQMS